MSDTVGGEIPSPAMVQRRLSRCSVAIGADWQPLFRWGKGGDEPEVNLPAAASSDSEPFII
jgi:hypothetical protein